MSENRFDAATRSLSGAKTRRGLLAAVVGLFLGAGSAAAQVGNPGVGPCSRSRCTRHKSSGGWSACYYRQKADPFTHSCVEKKCGCYWDRSCQTLARTRNC